MSGLNPSSIDLAVSSKVQIASILKDLLPSARFIMAIGSGLAETGKDVNPTLGNNFEMEWDDGTEQLTIHNDYPVYIDTLSQDYYYIDAIDPSTDKVIALASLTSGATPYNHLFLVQETPVPVAHIGKIEIYPTANASEPIPVGTRIVYIGWIYRGANDEIILHNMGRLIDLAFLANTITYLDFLDINTGAKVTIQPTNILRYTGFFGPTIVKTIREIAIFILDTNAYPHMFAYAKISDHSLLESENLRIMWEVTI